MVLALGAAPFVPRIDAEGVMQAKRLSDCKRALDEAIQNSIAAFERSKAKAAPKEGMTHRTLMDQRQKQSTLCNYWATTIQDAVNEGIDNDLPEAVLQAGVKRIMELEEQANEEAKAASDPMKINLELLLPVIPNLLQDLACSLASAIAANV